MQVAINVAEERNWKDQDLVVEKFIRITSNCLERSKIRSSSCLFKLLAS